MIQILYIYDADRYKIGMKIKGRQEYNKEIQMRKLNNLDRCSEHKIFT